MPNPSQIELIGGPLHGHVHELDPLLAMANMLPAQIGMHGEADPTVLHWYDVDDSAEQPRAVFLRTDMR